MDPRFIRRLRKIVGKEHVRSGPADLEVYSYDASLARARPGAVVFPADTRETANVVRAASEADIPYVPRGFGTNLSGGSVAPENGLIICLSRLNRILSIRTDRRCAQVQAGVTNLELQNALAPLRFFYAPDPASQKVSTLGGNVGENSGGPRCVKHGVTKNHILGLEVVLPDGEAVRMGGQVLDPPGYDLCSILVGSEGTLGIVTEITVRILPSAESVVTLLAVYDRVADAARSVSEIIAEGIVPASLEMMDAPVMRAVEESYPCGYPLDAAAVLIIEVDGPTVGLKGQAERIREICSAQGCRQVREAGDSGERDLLWAGRRGAFGAIARLAPSYLVADCTVPRTKIPEALERVRAIAERHQLSHGNVFHAGDGNLHPLLFFDSRDPDQLRRVHEAGMEIMKESVELGGTITGEHGVGIEKLDAMHLIFSEDDLDAQRAVRHAFDPEQRLNPGKAIPAPARAQPAEEARGREISGAEELAPATAEEACEVVTQAFREGTALLPEGKGRWRRFGNTTDCDLLALRSKGLASIVEYDPPNQTITAEAGISLEELQGALKPNRQWLPIRPFLGKTTTLGSMLALGACGPERLRYGAPRDLLLGLRFVSGMGRLISTGGKVVKNVAGYDLGRLLAGSAGTLGFLTEITLRVSALPESCREARSCGSLEKIASAAGELLRSNIEPAFVVASPLNGATSGAGAETEQASWRLSVGLEGFGETVEAQAERCADLFARNGLRGEAARGYPVEDELFADTDESLHRAPFLLRADLPMDKVKDFVDMAAGATQTEGLFADFGCGRVRAGMEDLSEEAWERLCGHVGDLDGHILLEKAPDDFKRRQDVYGPSQSAWKVMHKVKEALDPKNIFAPGRLPGRK
jgi:D-lactate dehydrogenase (cytochrome)